MLVIGPHFSTAHYFVVSGFLSEFRNLRVGLGQKKLQEHTGRVGSVEKLWKRSGGQVVWRLAADQMVVCTKNSDSPISLQ